MLMDIAVVANCFGGQKLLLHANAIRLGIRKFATTYA